MEHAGTIREPLIIAHRGASSHAPENTLAAFRRAVEDGADGVEFDIRLAKDGVPMVIHDETLARTAGRSEKISDLTSRELNQIDVGSWFNTKFPLRYDPAFTRETIPTLAQAMRSLRAFDGWIYIELKTRDDDLHEITKAVCDIIRNSPLLPQIIIKSFKLSLIHKIKHHLPNVKTAGLFAPMIMSYLRRRTHLLESAQEFRADQISLHHLLAIRKLVRLASERKMPVTIWTVDNPESLKWCRELGVGALITNDPLRMLAARRLIV